MKTTKEYPATHSMETTWFAIDSEGNVGIFDIDCEGPVPEDIPSQECIEEISEELISNSNEESHLSGDQINELFRNAFPPESFLAKWDLKDYYTILIITLINPEKIELVHKAISLYKQNYMICLSHEMNAYIIRLQGFDSENKTVSLEEHYQTYINIFQQKAILKWASWNAYSFFEYLFNEEELDNRCIVLDLPLYVYAQKYGLLFDRIVNPSFPMKADQLSQKLQSKAIHLPFKFSETDSFQIAEFLKSDIYNIPEDGFMIYKDRLYNRLTTASGKDIYCCSSIMPIVGCSENTLLYGRICNRCEKWKINEGDTTLIKVSTSYNSRPTVLFINGIKYEKANPPIYNDCNDTIIRHSAITPIIHGFPNLKGHFVFEKEAMDLYGDEGIKNLFSCCKIHLERLIDELKPYVLLASDFATECLAEQYNIYDHTIEIAGLKLPFYHISEMETNRPTIENYALMPYRGIELPTVIPLDQIPEEALFYNPSAND